MDTHQLTASAWLDLMELTGLENTHQCLEKVAQISKAKRHRGVNPQIGKERVNLKQPQTCGKKMKAHLYQPIKIHKQINRLTCKMDLPFHCSIAYSVRSTKSVRSRVQLNLCRSSLEMVGVVLDCTIPQSCVWIYNLIYKLPPLGTM